MSTRRTRRSLIGSYRYSVVIKPDSKEFSESISGSIDLYDGKHVLQTHQFENFDQLATMIINFWENKLGSDVNVHRFSNWLSEYFSDIGVTNINFYQMIETVRNLGKGVALHSSGHKIREAKVIREPLEPVEYKGLPSEITWEESPDTLLKPSELFQTEETVSPTVTTLPPIKEEKEEEIELPPDDTLLKPSEALQEKETIFEVDEDYQPTFATIAAGDPVITTPVETPKPEVRPTETLLRPSEYLKQRDTIDSITVSLKQPSYPVEKKTRISPTIKTKPVKERQLKPPEEALLKPSEYLKERKTVEVDLEKIPPRKIDPTEKQIPVPYEIPAKPKEKEPSVKKKSELPFEIEVVEVEELPEVKAPLKVTDIMGVGEKLAMLLKDGGFVTLEDLIKATPEELSKLRSIGVTTAKKIIYGAKALKSQESK